MTYLDWGCEQLARECESCLDALCRACRDEFAPAPPADEDEYDPDNFSGETEPGSEGPDCDLCEPEKKPDCSRCEIIFEVCRKCPEYESCEFRLG